MLSIVFKSCFIILAIARKYIYFCSVSKSLQL